ncbi:MAG: hypothetical protein KDA92_04445 [Planctomycetales bacterium]|nr:hypothetical protein [Planctomycetales bacterium]MCA9166165.1 hypothetical protein [Planctomycetales bacterium]
MKRQYLAAACLLMSSLAVGCQSKMGGGCAGGQCGLLGGGSCGAGACAADPYAADANAGRGGVLAGLAGQHHQGAQAHLGSAPGPAMGEAAPTYGYPYYTTRGPRDFLSSNPPSIGR